MRTVPLVPAPGWTRARGVVVAAAAVVSLTGLQLARQPGTRAWQSVWAEDGAIYGREAFALPIWRTLFRGYGGYVQLVPRILAALARVVGLSGLAATFAVAASFVTALLAVFVFRCSRGWIDDPSLRAVVAAMTALVPIAYIETNANIANLGWPLLVASAWAVVSRQTRRGDTIARTGVVVATALSTTIGALLLPGALLVARRRRQRRDAIVAASFAGALAVQLVLDRTAASSPPYQVSSSAGDLLQVFGVRVLGSVVVGERWLPNAWSAWRYGVVLLAFAALAALMVACRRAGRDRWLLAVAAVTVAFTLFAVPVWIRGSSPMRLHPGELRPDGARYLVAPIVLVVSAVAVLVDGARRAWLRRVLVVHSLVLMVVGFQVANLRSTSTPWETAVQHARVDCASKPETAVERVPISPARWSMPISCDHVGRAAARQAGAGASGAATSSSRRTGEPDARSTDTPARPVRLAW